MSHKRYFSYIRVSTVRQGQHGTSLAEQLAAIERFAARLNLQIIKQYEEQETAAKAGRPVFLEMLKALRRGQADGVIIHKIDRSARNLKDWADLGSLMDSGIEVHFANESVDLQSRGGRLSADIQAVVASDYIRNLREEVRKGFYGRLKQGLYPMPAPIGYTDKGQGQPKEPHPVYAPLVRKAFELYATGKYGILSLTKKMKQLGLQSKSGRTVSKNSLNGMLKNEFYTGLIRIEKTGEVFRGLHQPIVSQKLFERVQAVMSGKTIDKQQTHFFVFKQLINCQQCRYRLVAERQKGHVYYRCHSRDCPQKTVREEMVEKNFFPVLDRLGFDERENYFLKRELERRNNQSEKFERARRQALQIQLESCQARLSKLTDALIEGAIERELFVPKKNTLVTEEHRLQEELKNLEGKEQLILKKTAEILELSNQACFSYKQGNPQQKREMVKIIASNLFANGKTVIFKLNYPFELIANRYKSSSGGAHRDVPRTYSSNLSQLLENLYEFLSVTDVDHK